MERSNYRFTLDIRDCSGGCVLDTKRGDTHRRLHMLLSDGGTPYPVTADCFPVLMAKTEDGRLIYSQCDVEDGTVVCDITSAYTVTPGAVQCELRLYAAPFDEEEPDAQLLTSATFVIQVHPTVYNSEEELSVAGSVEASALTSLVTLARSATAQAKAIAQELELQRDLGEFDGMSISHSWNGTVLSVASRSGVSSADLKGEKGDKGDRGATGPQGPKGDSGVDDSCAGEYPWSGAHVVSAFCPSFRTTGLCVNCTPMSPSSLEITGEKDCAITVCGKNLFDPATKLNVGYVYMGSGSLHNSQEYRYTDPIPAAHLVGKMLTLNKLPGGVNPGMCFYGADGALLGFGKGAALTVPEGTSYLRFSLNKAAAAEGKIQLEVGNTATAYEPYYAENYQLTAGETLSVEVFGGVRNVYSTDTQLQVSGYSDLLTELQKLKREITKLKNS